MLAVYGLEYRGQLTPGSAEEAFKTNELRGVEKRATFFGSASEQGQDQPFEGVGRVHNSGVSHHRFTFLQLLLIFVLLLLALLLLVFQIIQKMLQIYELVPLQPLKDSRNLLILQLLVMLMTVLQKVLIVQQLK